MAKFTNSQFSLAKTKKFRRQSRAIYLRLLEEIEKEDLMKNVQTIQDLYENQQMVIGLAKLMAIHSHLLCFSSQNIFHKTGLEIVFQMLAYKEVIKTKSK